MIRCASRALVWRGAVHRQLRAISKLMHAAKNTPYSLGSNDRYGVKNVRTATIELNEIDSMPFGDPLGQDAQAGVAARCCAASASQRAMSAATSVLCDAGMRGHSGTLIHSR